MSATEITPATAPAEGTAAESTAAVASRAHPGNKVGFALLAGLLATVAGGKAILYDTIDPDCFWHLKVAEQLRTDGIGPIVDRLSFSSLQTPWTPYSWLAELAMKATWDAGGYRLAVGVQAAMQAMFVVLICWACRRARPSLARRAKLLPGVGSTIRSAEARPSYLACCVAAAAMAFISLPYLSFRPVTASLLLLAACSLLIVRDRARDERTKLIWLVPVLTAVNVNLHMTAVFVPAWFGALWVGAVWERLFVALPAEQPEAARRTCRCFLLAAASVLGCCCTPLLPGVIEAAWQYRSADPMVASGYLAEMRPFLYGTTGLFNSVIVLGTLALVLWRLPRFRVGERLWLAGSVLALAQWGRMSPVFAVAAGPMLAVALGGTISDRVLSRRPARLAMAAVLLTAVVRLAAMFPGADQPLSAWMNRHGPDAPNYPHEAAQYVARSVTPKTGRLVSEFSWGGYLEWELGDRYQLLLDGRTQLFAPSFWRDTYLGGEAARAAFMAQVDADAAILPGRESVFRHALVRLGWRSAWRDKDGSSEVLLPPTRPAVAPETLAADDVPPAPEKPKRWPIFSSLLPD